MSSGGRGLFRGRAGVILASAGSAVGLGNIWRFPTEVGRNGGAAFLLVYLCFVFLLALPVMLAEFVIGRGGRANAVGAFRALAPGRPWAVAGFIGVAAGVMVLSYYSVVAGWTVRYTFCSLLFRLPPGEDHAARFASFVSSSWGPLACQCAFLLLTHVIVARGVEAGIERFSKLMMPALLVIMAALACCSLTMPGAAEGVRFLLSPDFGKISPEVVLSAMGQAFFSLSVGIGTLATYASYFSDDTPLARSAAGVCVIDTLVAVASGLVIFPAVFSVPGMSAGDGPGLVFVTLPHVFGSAFSGAPVAGYVFSGMFYVLLLLAALTSSISMHEIATAFVHENYHLPRRASAAAVTALCMALGAACSLSFGAWGGVRLMGMGFFELFDFLTAKFLMPMGGILITVFAGWRMSRQDVVSQLTNCGRLRPRFLPLLVFLIRWVAPVGVGAVFVFGLAR